MAKKRWKKRAKKLPSEVIHMGRAKNSHTSKGRVRVRKIGFATCFKPRVHDAVRRATRAAWWIERRILFIIPLWMGYRYEHRRSTSDFFHPKEYMLRAILSAVFPPDGGAQVDDVAQRARIDEVRQLLRERTPRMLQLGESSSNLHNVLGFMMTRALVNQKNLVVRNYVLVLRGWAYAAYKRDSAAARALGGGRELTDDELWQACRGVTDAMLARRLRDDYPADVRLHWRDFLPVDYAVAASATNRSALLALHDALEGDAASTAGGALWRWHECMWWAHTRTCELGGHPSAEIYPLPPVEPIPNFQRFDLTALVKYNESEILEPLNLTKTKLFAGTANKRESQLAERRTEVFRLYVNESAGVFGATTPLDALSSVLTDGVRAHLTFGDTDSLGRQLRTKPTGTPTGKPTGKPTEHAGLGGGGGHHIKKKARGGGR